MPKKTTDKIKISATIDIAVDKVIKKLATRMNLKYSYIINEILVGALLQEYFVTADVLESDTKEKRRKK